MKNLIALLLLILVSCQDGPKATYNEDFVSCYEIQYEVSINDLIGKYELDKDSKIRYNIPDSLDFYIELGINNKKDTFISANRYINPKDRTIIDKKFSNKALYINESKSLRPFNNNDFLGGGIISIYINKKDNKLALYAYTPFVPTTEKNGMQYKEGDYLRYIKVITDSLKYEKTEQKIKHRLTDLFEFFFEALSTDQDDEGTFDKTNTKKSFERFEIEELLKDTIKKEVEKEYASFYKFKKINDSIIMQYDSLKQTEKYGYYVTTDKFININNSLVYYDFPYDSFDPEFNYSFLKIKDLVIREYREEKKIINNINCFKVIVSYTEINLDEDFPQINTIMDEKNYNEEELWVTEDIMSIYHPAYEIKEILEKYYPLEISNKNSFMDGLTKKLTLEEIRLTD